MPIEHPPQGGAVLYAKNVERLVSPAHIASSIQIGNPPVRRENTPVKLVFFVESIAEARTAADPLGGALNPASEEWRFEEHRVCDGHDPEGNVFQLREARAYA